MNKEATKESVISEFRKQIDCFEKRQISLDIPYDYNRELAALGISKLKMLTERYFPESSYAKMLTGISAMRNPQGFYYDKAFEDASNFIITLIDEISFSGYDWEDYHTIKPPKPSRLELILRNNKTVLVVCKSIVPVIVVFGLAFKGQLQNMQWAGTVTTGVAFLAIFFPELKSFFKKSEL